MLQIAFFLKQESSKKVMHKKKSYLLMPCTLLIIKELKNCGACDIFIIKITNDKLYMINIVIFTSLKTIFRFIFNFLLP